MDRAEEPWFGGDDGPVSRSFVDGAAGTLIGVGLDQGKKLVSGKLSFISSFTNALRSYFDVDSYYVLRKLLLLLFPFRRVSRDRPGGFSSSRPSPSPFPTAASAEVDDFGESYGSGASGGGGGKSRSLAKPDLYIPTLSFVTFTLLSIALSGRLDGPSLDPSDRPSVATSAAARLPDIFTNSVVWGLVVVLFEACVYKMGLWILSTPGSFDFLALVSFAGYKYFSVLITTLTSLLLGNWGYWISLLYLSLSMAVFLQRGIENMIEESATTDAQKGVMDTFDEKKTSRKYFLFVVSLLEIPVFLVLTFSYRNIGVGFWAVFFGPAITTLATSTGPRPAAPPPEVNPPQYPRQPQRQRQPEPEPTGPGPTDVDPGEEEYRRQEYGDHRPPPDEKIQMNRRGAAAGEGEEVYRRQEYQRGGERIRGERIPPPRADVPRERLVEPPAMQHHDNAAEPPT